MARTKSKGTKDTSANFGPEHADTSRRDRRADYVAAYGCMFTKRSDEGDIRLIEALVA